MKELHLSILNCPIGVGHDKHLEPTFIIIMKSNVNHSYFQSTPIL